MVFERLTTDEHRVGDTTRVAVHGELDCGSVPSLEGEMETVFARGGPVVFDLRDLRFTDVSGVRLAVRLEGRAQLHGVPYATLRGPEAVQRVFEMTGMGRFGGF